MPKRIAIVEDEAELASLIEYNLVRHGYESHILTGSKGTLKLLEQAKPDLIVLDVMLPDADGFELCRQIRQSPVLARIPVLFLTARSDEVDRVLGLEIGGDDYMTKPFSPRELIARVKAHLRREEMDAEPPSMEIGPFRLDRKARRVFQADAELSLTSTEFNLLEFFLTHPGPRLQPRPASGIGVGRAALRHPAHGGCARPPPARADRGPARKSALPHYRARLRLPLRGGGLTGRIFSRLMAAVGCLFLLAVVSLEFLHTGILWGVAASFLAATLLAALLARSLARGFEAVLGDAAETAEKLRKTVEQLQRERAEIERVERVRKDFVINVSHELRTPLASIQGYTETLMDGALNDPEYNMRFLGIIRHNAERLARITQDLLTSRAWSRSARSSSSSRSARTAC